MDVAQSAAFIQSMTYEVGAIDYAEFPRTEEPVWVLGNKYSALYDLEDLREYIKSRLWFTYRKGFAAIGGDGPTSDTGWGCMLRCGQMMLAQALVCRHLQRNWKWQNEKYDPKYSEILRQFLDKRNNCYSIHQIASMGASEGKAVGTWFGPNTIAQVLKKLVQYDTWSGIELHIAMDNMLVKEEVLQLCRQKVNAKKRSGKGKHKSTNSSKKEDKVDSNQDIYACETSGREDTTGEGGEEGGSTWKPLLLMIPLRLGLTDINPVYVESLKNCLTFRQSVGIIGGKPNHAHWFIGFVGDEVIYLDPHTTQQATDLTQTDATDESYHCPYTCRMDIMGMDPSIALGFFCNSEGDFEDLCSNIGKTIIRGKKTPMLELHNERTNTWPLCQPLDTQPAGATATASCDPLYDTDEEFELL